MELRKKITYFLLGCIIGHLLYILIIRNWIGQPINKQIKQTTKKIDSLKQNKETSNKAILDTFKRNKVKSSTLIKSLPKEPSIILQADYKAMCDSILNYKSTKR